MARRAAKRREDGTVRQLPSGRWQARYWDEVEGKQRSAPRTFDTKMDAVAWLDKGDRVALVAEVADPVFADYAASWLAARPLKPRTREGYEVILRDHILPTFGERRLRGLTPAMVRDWYASLCPTSPTRRKHAYTLLSTICRTAVEEEILQGTPCRVRRATVVEVKHEAQVPTREELDGIVALMPERHRLAVLLAAWCGLRIGELTELRRGDVVDGDLRIRRAVVRHDGGFLVQTPKSRAGRRDVAIPPPLLPLLAEHLDRHVGPASDALLFPAQHGGHLAPTSLYVHFYKARAAIGREDLRWHDLRHHGATVAAEKNATLVELQARLGHSTVAAAMRYQHAAQGADRRLAARLMD
jgi:integrase